MIVMYHYEEKRILFSDHEAAMKEKDEQISRNDTVIAKLLSGTESLKEQIAALKAELEEGRRVWAESDEHKNADELRSLVEKQASVITTLQNALTEQRRRMGAEYDDLDAKLKQVQSNVSWELKDYAKSMERANREIATLNAENARQAEEIKRLRGKLSKAINDEPEYPGKMPDEMWEAMKGDRDAVTEALRLTVKLTKKGIRNRFMGIDSGENLESAIELVGVKS